MINSRKISIHRFCFCCDNAVSYGQRVTTLIRQCKRMTVKLHELAIKAKYRLLWDIKNSCYAIQKQRGVKTEIVCDSKIALLDHKVLE